MPVDRYYQPMLEEPHLESSHLELAKALKQALEAVEQEATQQVYSAMRYLPVIAYDEPCVECREKFKPGDLVTWRLRWVPQGLIHKDCQ